MSEFFWLLNGQREATNGGSKAVNGAGARPQQQQDSGGGEPAPDTPLAAEPGRSAALDGQEDGQSAAAAAVLHALACSAADVPAFLECRGFSVDSARLQAACNVALLAVLRQDKGARPTPQTDRRPGSVQSDHENHWEQHGNGPSACAGSYDEELPAGGAPDDEPAEATAHGSPPLEDRAEEQLDVWGQADAAAVHGVPAVVRRLLSLGADAGWVGGGGAAPPLMAALAGGHLEAAALLLDAGAQADPPTWMGAGAAEAAPSTREAHGEAGGTQNGKRKRGTAAGQGPQAAVGATADAAAQPSPLVLAVVAGSALLVGRLLAAGANPSRRCTMSLPGSGRCVALTPLIAAVNAGSAALAGQLLAAGADLHQKCVATAAGDGGADWTSALSAAVLAGDAGMVRLLVAAGGCAGRGGGPHVGQDHPALRAVALAAQRGHADLLRLLYPPLAAALQGGTAAMVGMLKRRTALHPLAAAAERGHLEAVELLLELGAPASHDGSVVGGVAQHTPLMLAAGKGHAAVVERLLAAGACPLRVNARQQMAAALALQNGQLTALRVLLRHGGELVANTAQGQPAPSSTPAPGHLAGLPQRPQLSNASKAWQLGFAVGLLPGQRPLTLSALEHERQRYQQLLLALLEARLGEGGAPAAAHVRLLASPTSLAHAAAGSDALLDALLACGASLASVDPVDGSFALLAACHHGWTPMLRLLSRGADPNQADAAGRTALALLAARPAMLEAARQLLGWHVGLPPEQRQLDLLRRDAEGRDALGLALAAKNRRCAEELLDCLMALERQARAAGAAQGHPSVAAEPPAAAVPACQPAAMLASPTAARVCDVLVEMGARCLADVNRPGRDGQHVLVSRVQAGARKRLRHLLQLPGLDVNVRDDGGRTPLMLAVASQKAGLVQDILATGRAQLEARDGAGCTAALLAARAGASFLLRLLLDAGADISVVDNTGGTAMMALAAQGQHKLLSELLPGVPAAGVNAADGNGWTALHHAAAAGSFNSCKVLRNWGADPGLRASVGGPTAAGLAAQRGHTSCLPLLAADTAQQMPDS